MAGPPMKMAVRERYRNTYDMTMDLQKWCKTISEDCQGKLVPKRPQEAKYISYLRKETIGKQY